MVLILSEFVPVSGLGVILLDSMSQAAQEFLRNPPKGSKTRAAMDFGIDLSLVYENLLLTPEQRLRKTEATRASTLWLDEIRAKRTS